MIKNVLDTMTPYSESFLFLCIFFLKIFTDFMYYLVKRM